MTEPVAAPGDTTLVGAGIHDITGPAAERIMMGYVSFSQQTKGIHMRLRSRAFVIASPTDGRRLVIVSADLGMVFQAVKRDVVAALRRSYGDLYTEGNVILGATHSHAGPGGYSDYKLYYLTCGGFDRANFQAITHGIFQSIRKAHDSLAPGTVKIASGDLIDASVNRSLPAYDENPEDERARYHHDTDKAMTVLRLDRTDGSAVGMISWFPVHGTSLGNDNELISGDNKGYAAYLFEKTMGTDYNSDRTFVAAFLQSNEGDASPNIFGNGYGGGRDDFESLEIAGRKQYEKALSLYRDAQKTAGMPVDYRATNVDFSSVEVASSWADGQPRRTCPAALGISMLAGTEDGRGIGREGKSPFRKFLSKEHFTDCQGTKEVVVPVGKLRLAPCILPVQVARIGRLGIMAVPFELTTMAGRRLRGTVLDALRGCGVDQVEITGLSNAYAGYVTTREEYGSQQYEGGSTHFGPWTLAALQQESARLAVAMANDSKVDPGPPTKPGSRWLINLRPGVLFDLSLPFARIGSVRLQPSVEYRAGEEVTAEFWGGHPRNNFLIQSTFLEVQRREHNQWATVARDWDPETRFLWDRRLLICSLITVKWLVPAGTMPGVYRILHRGYRKRLLGGVRAYEAFTQEFSVV